MPSLPAQVEESGKALILTQFDERKRLYESFSREVEHQVRLLLNACDISYNSITQRVKDRGSLADKIDRKGGKYSKLENITDIAGVRIITYYSEDVDRVSNIIETEFDVDHVNSIDKRKALEPDKFGYCSVHYVVKMSASRLALREYQMYQGLTCEIQIRSVLQHAWAEIEHDTGYKSEKPIPRELRRSFSRIAGLLEIADKEFDSIRNELAKYKKDAEEKINNDEFGNKEIDGVIIEVSIETNTNLKQLNEHISNLTGVVLDHKINPENAADKIKALNWVGIHVVDDLLKALQKYYEFSLAIANEMLKDFKSKTENEGAKISATIGLFYLCYAVLLDKENSVDRIRAYLLDNDIGWYYESEETAHELLSYKERFGHLIKQE